MISFSCGPRDVQMSHGITFYNIYRPGYLYSTAKCGKMCWCAYWMPVCGSTIRRHERREAIEDQDPEDSFSNFVLFGGGMHD